MVKFLYTVFLGALLAILVGVGIQAFYPQPPAPKYPTELNTLGKEPTNAELQAERAFQAKQDEWNEKMKPYNRNVSIIAMIFALIFVSVGMLLEQKLPVLADGIVLGGVFTLLYSMGRGFASSDSKYSFMVALLGVIIAIVVGYLRFIKPDHGHTLAASKKPVKS